MASNDNKDSPKGSPCYSDYLHIATLLSLQDGPSSLKESSKGLQHDEEEVFIVVHQVIELWFKLVLRKLKRAHTELSKLVATPTKESQQDSSLFLLNATGDLRTIDVILGHSLTAFHVMETMHPSDFLEFREFLGNGSGMQSCQFRKIESLLGCCRSGSHDGHSPDDTNRSSSPAATTGSANVKQDSRPFADRHVLSFLPTNERAEVEQLAQREESFATLFIRILAAIRIPSTFKASLCEGYEQTLKFAKGLKERSKERLCPFLKEPVATNSTASMTLTKDTHTATTKDSYSFAELLENPSLACEHLSLTTLCGIQSSSGSQASLQELFNRAVHGALFITAYRHDPRYALLAELLDAVANLEETLLRWRSQHLRTVERMLGTRSGTGGSSSGASYLEETLQTRCFYPLCVARKLAVRTTALPPLSTEFGQELFER